MKRAISFWLVITLTFIALSLIASAKYYESIPSKYAGNKATTFDGNYSLNTYILEKYNIVSYGEPFGSPENRGDPTAGWMASDNGLMTKKNNPNEKGEYKYLGVNYYGEPINNDRWFRDESRLGTVFNKDYSNEGIAWVRNSADQSAFWNDYKITHPEVFDYMQNIQFWDADHITAGVEPTGYTLKTFGTQVLKGDFTNFGILQTPVTRDTTGVVRFNYTKHGQPNWTTVEIPPFPEVKCIMTAAPDISRIPAGETADVTITIDTTKSYVQFRALGEYKISSRHYWTTADVNNYGAGKTTIDGICEITVKDVKPNSPIYVKAEVFCQQIADSKIPDVKPYDTAVQTIFIGESGQNVYMDADAGAVIKADPRGSERFDVTKGVPSGEPLYTNVSANEYICRLVPVYRTGTLEYTINVSYKKEDEEGAGMEAETGEETGEGLSDTVAVPVTVTRSYGYWEIQSLDIYAIDSATVRNKALPGESVTMVPPAGYGKPEVTYIKTSDHYSIGNVPSTAAASGPDDVNEAAERAVPSASGINDILIINGKTILSESEFYPGNLAPGKIDWSILYKDNLVIDPAIKNNTYASSGSITYKRVLTVNSSGEDTLTFPINGINSVSVHTPVYTDLSVSSDDVHNQKPEPAEGMSSLILGRPFTVDIANAGTHRSIPGYGVRDYTAYIKDREIRFGFDAYFGTDMTGKYLKRNTWYSLEGLGVSNNVGQIAFYTPSWVDEGTYGIEVRTLASNYTSGAGAQRNMNADPNRYAAYDTRQVEVSGRVYDFAVTDIDDPAWETFFRVAKGKPEPTGNIFYVGPNNINGDANPSTKYILPVMPGKNDRQGYGDRAVKLGYAFKFDIRTIGNYCDELDFLQIRPKFYYVDSAGRNRQEVDLYYSTPSKPMIRVGSAEDTLTQNMKLNFAYRGINPGEFTNTAEAMFNLRGGIRDYTLEKFKEAQRFRR